MIKDLAPSRPTEDDVGVRYTWTVTQVRYYAEWVSTTQRFCTWVDSMGRIGLQNMTVSDDDAVIFESVRLPGRILKADTPNGFLSDVVTTYVEDGGSIFSLATTRRF